MMALIDNLINQLYDPATATTTAATPVAVTTAAINGSFDAGGAEVESAGFYFSVNADLSGSTTYSVGVQSGSFSKALTELSMGTTYYFAAFVTNEAGTVTGSTQNFTTDSWTCGVNTVTFDGFDYQTVQIGSQCWLKQNLRSDNYRNGDPIPTGFTNTQWGALSFGAQTVYNQDESSNLLNPPSVGNNLEVYGRLYNGYAVIDSRGICPTNWHVPTSAEWNVAINLFGGTSVSAPSFKSSGSDSPAWDGTNVSGFSGLPGGMRLHTASDGGLFSPAFLASYIEAGYYGVWWAGDNNGSSAPNFNLTSGYSNWTGGTADNRMGLSVRCIKD